VTPVKTTCPYCGVGCGIIATPTGNRSVEVKGDPDHPANRGQLCSKGTHLGETVGLEGRLLYPEMAGSRIGWDKALDAVAKGFREAIDAYGPDSVAIYGSGQLLTEDYYAANKLMKGYIGTANIDTNSRLCMASAVVAHNRAFGEDVVPVSYDDIDSADLIILVGSNTAWCHPIIWQRIEAARAARGTKLVVIDPRRTETAAGGDLHLAVRPDGDTALFNAALVAMRARGLVDEDYLAQQVVVPEGFWETLDPPRNGEGDHAKHGGGGWPQFGTPPPSALRAATSPCRGGIEHLTGLATNQLTAFFDLLAANPRTLTIFSMGANQSVGGVDKGNAIINLHLATGRIGKPGAGPFSITGQPNAMGGREVGGLATTLAVHMGFSEEERIAAQCFWNSPAIAPGPGLKAVDLFRAVDSGQIKALWIMATNPAVSMPDSDFVRAAIAKCPLVIVSDIIADTDTAKLAHIKLPALGWGEKDGTVTNSERVISRQRAVFAAPGEARADWAIVADVAQRMGFADGFNWANNAEVFTEYAAMTRACNAGSRALIVPEPADYESMEPIQWGGASPFAKGRYSHPDGKAQLVSVKPVPPAESDLLLNTGRYRDQWHTMTRTGLSPRLSQHRREPLLEIHPDDAAAHGMADRSFAEVKSAASKSRFRVHITEDQRPGEIFVPMHWTDQLASDGRGNRAVTPQVDPHSGQPGCKKSAVRIAPFATDWRGFLVTRQRPDFPADIFWTASRLPEGWLVELAGQGPIDAAAMLPEGEVLEAFDTARGTRRLAVRTDDGRLAAALFLTRSGALPDRDWIAAQLSTPAASGPELLAGRAATPAPDRGGIVCVCFDVGTKTILGAIADQRLTSVEAIGTALNAGTNCGSCRPAIRALLETVKELEHA
jgi:assimilatory nitrate reductase catalytic subunit